MCVFLFYDPAQELRRLFPPSLTSHALYFWQIVAKKLTEVMKLDVRRTTRF